MSFIFAPNDIPDRWPIAATSCGQYAPRDTGFPSDCTEADLSEFWLFELSEGEQPSFDAATQRVVELTPQRIAGAWTRQWSVVDLTPEEIAALAPKESVQAHYGYASVSYVAGQGAVLRPFSVNVGGASRVSTGRYRIYDIANSGLQIIVRSITIKHDAFLLHRMSSCQAHYVEVRFANLQGVAVDPTEFVVEIDKVIMQ